MSLQLLLPIFYRSCYFVSYSRYVYHKFLLLPLVAVLMVAKRTKGVFSAGFKATKNHQRLNGLQCELWSGAADGVV